MVGRALLLLSVLLLAGCSGKAPPQEPGVPGAGSDPIPDGIPTVDVVPLTNILFEDVAGDAYETTSEAAAENADRQIDTTCALLPEAQPACAALPSDSERSRLGGIPARPALDLRSVEWVEGAANLTVAFLVESWDGDWDTLLPRPGSGAAYFLSWTTNVGNVSCPHTVTVQYNKHGNGVGVIGQAASLGACRRIVNVATTAVPGTPARFEVHVPWAALPNHVSGAELTNVYAATSADEASSTGGVIGYRGNLRPVSQYNIDYAGQIVDDVPALELTSVRRGPIPVPAAPLQQTLYLDDDPAPAVERRDLDIQSVGLHSSEQFLTINVTLTEVDAPSGSPDAAARDHMIYMQFDGNNTHPSGVPTIYILQSEVVGGARNFTGYKLVAPDLHVEAFPFEGSIVPGSPGIVSFRIDRNDMEPFRAGDILQRFSPQANVGSLRDSQQIAAGQGTSHIVTARIYDSAAGYLVIATGPSGGTDVEEVVLTDGRDDTAPPRDAIAQRSDGQADVVRAEMRVIGPDLARVVLAMGDLGSVEVPAGYDAIFNGLAVQTVEGTFTIGFRLDASGVPRFFCGGDRTVFAATPADPLAGTVTDITGRLLPGPSPGTVGVIVFDVPASCFGALHSDEDFRLSMTKVRAASYFIRSTASALGPAGVVLVDDVESSEPLALTFRTALPPGPPTFWEKPFGVDNFWDLAGIAFTALSSLAALALLVRRRTRFKRYLRRIEHIRHHTADAPTRATQLSAVRRELQSDLLRNRMPSDHFAIVEARLNPLLTRARTAVLADLVPDIPDGLLARLETFIADGALSASERSRFIALAKPQMTARQLTEIEAAIVHWG